MRRRRTLALSTLVCLLLAGAAAAQPIAHETEGGGFASADPLLGGATGITQNLDPNTITLTQVICAGNADYSFWRLYDLDGEFGLSGPLCAESVDYGVREATVPQNVTANVYCLNDGDAFALANLTQVGSDTIVQPAAELEFFNIPVGGCCDAASQSMAVQIEGSFLQGFNQSGQTAPSYMYCPSGGIFAITDLADFGIDWALIQVVNLTAEELPTLAPWGLAATLVLLLAGLTLALARRRS